MTETRTLTFYPGSELRVIDFEIEYQKTAKNAGEDCGCNVSLPIPGLASQPATPALK